METDSLPFGELIKRLSTIYEKRANRNMQAQNVTVSQMLMLSLLDLQPGGTMPLKELERACGVAQSTAAGVVVRLEKKNLIRAVGDPADRRVKILQITDAGREICAAAEADMKAFDRGMLSCLSDGEREQLLRLMTRVYEAQKDV